MHIDQKWGLFYFKAPFDTAKIVFDTGSIISICQALLLIWIHYAVVENSAGSIGQAYKSPLALSPG